MTRKGNPEDARLWIAEAEKRLEHAKDYISRRDRRIFCEQAHYAAEFAIKGLIVAGNGEFQFTHDIGVLLEAVRKTGETIPREAEDATILSPYGGPGRYSFEREHDREQVTQEEYEQSIKAASAAVDWAKMRTRDILAKRDGAALSRAKP